MKLISTSLWICCVASACMGYFLFIRPNARSLSRLVLKEVRLEQQLTSDSLLAANSQSIREHTKIAESMMKASGIALPMSICVAHSLRLLHAFARKRHIVVDSVRLLQSDRSPKSARIDTRTLELDIRGSFRNELAFFRELPKLPGVVLRLDGISFASQPSSLDVSAHAVTSLLSLHKVLKP